MAIHPCSAMRVAQLKENIAINNKHFLENIMNTYDLNEMRTKLNALRTERDTLIKPVYTNQKSYWSTRTGEEPIEKFELEFGISYPAALIVVKYLNLKISKIETDIKNQLAI